jgi:hypothetical protein
VVGCSGLATIKLYFLYASLLAYERSGRAKFSEIIEEGGALSQKIAVELSSRSVADERWQCVIMVLHLIWRLRAKLL